MTKTTKTTHSCRYASMVSFMDGAIGNITDLLHSKGMWDDTIIFFQSDNGGPSFAGSSHTANNWPLKGTKMSNWEGGIRVNAFVSGGYLAKNFPHMVGVKLDGLVSIADYYATCAGTAGEDPTDHRAAAAKLPPIDGLNMWPYFTGHNILPTNRYLQRSGHYMRYHCKEVPVHSSTNLDLMHASV